MSKRFRMVIGLLLASVLGLVVWQASRPFEPVFEGRTLTSWLDHHVPTSAADPPYNSPGWKKADEALLRIGTNAIPTLLRMIRAKDPPALALRLLDLAQGHRWVKIRYRRAFNQNEEAEYAFERLGTNASAAVPGLLKIYQEARSPSSQRCAALALGHIGRAAEPAIPVLLRNFTHTNDEVRIYAVSAVLHIGGEPRLVVPAFRSVLKDPRVEVRWNAVSALGRLGRRAAPAVPDLLEALNDPGRLGNDTLKEQVELALWWVAPEKIGTVVVEDPTPLVAEGITTEALKVIFNGQRKTLIPSGRPVPCQAQYWDSGPRDPISLYRGSEGTTEKDLFLGQFEVMGMSPPPESVNVSVLCIIANQQILLSARDNNRREFLQIHRVK